MIEYYVKLRPKSHIVVMTMVIHSPTQKQLFSMAKWIPGSYCIRDFARHVMSIQVSDGKIQKINSNTWEVVGATSPLVVTYEVYAFDPSVRGVYVDDEQAFINPVGVCMRVHGHERESHYLYFDEKKECATTLACVQTKTGEGIGFEASSYDELIDHPIQMGAMERYEFEINNIPHAVVITGIHDGAIDLLLEDLKKIVKNHLFCMGEPAPFSHYYFLLSLKKEAYGGLEHGSSSALQISRDALPTRGQTEKSSEYIQLLALFSHEYFHAWQVKRIKPLCFVEYDLDKPVHTRQLWAFEGIPSYYDDLALVRSGAITVKQYVAIIAKNVTALQRAPGRGVQNLAEASFDTWIKFYQPNENTNNATVSYYTKGACVALALDLHLRHTTAHRVSLDDLMRMLWQTYGRQARGIPEGDIEAQLIAMGGKTVEDFLAKALHGTEEIPWELYFAPFGLSMVVKSAGIDNMQCTITRLGGKIIISTVLADGAGQLAGLCPQDEIVAVDRFQVDADTWDKRCNRLEPGQTVTVAFFRQGILTERRVTLQASAVNTIEIAIKSSLTIQEKENLQKWLGYEVSLS